MGSPEAPALRPAMIQVEIGTDCNLTCGFCPMLHAYRGRPSHRMSAADFRTVFGHNFPHPHMTVFSGFAETLLNDELWEMAAFEKSRGNEVLVATNALLLDEERREKLLAVGADKVTVTLDALDPELYARLRGSRELGRILAHVEAFQREIAARGAPTEIVVNYVVTRSTAPTIGEFLRYMASVGLGNVCFIKIMKDRGANGRIYEREFLDWEDYAAIDWTPVAETAAALGIRYERSDGALLASKGCELPFHGLYVSAHFDLSCCPFLVQYPEYVFGNLLRQDIDEIFASPPFRALRESFDQKRPPESCRACACLFSR